MENKKYRHELKYVCSEQQMLLIENRIRNICKPDVHAGAGGRYTVRSVYFDDYNNTCFYENENGIDPREKFRIRIYNGSTERINLECKQKRKGMTHKESCLLTKEQCDSILSGEWQPNFHSCASDEPDTNLLRKFYLDYQSRMFRGKVIVQYERTPYVYSIGNVRITFDRYISASNSITDFFEDKLTLRPVMPLGQHILEVKYDELLPDYLYNAMQISNLIQTNFSKYYLCRKFCL